MAVILAVIVWLSPASSQSTFKATPQAGSVTATITNATAISANSNARLVTPEIQKIVEQRCVMCHGEQVQMKNIRLDSSENLQKNAAMVYQQVIVTKLMPMNNATGLTPEERQTLGEWSKP